MFGFRIDGKITGPGKEFKDNSYLYQGEFKNGAWHGLGMHRNSKRITYFGLWN